MVVVFGFVSILRIIGCINTDYSFLCVAYTEDMYV